MAWWSEYSTILYWSFFPGVKPQTSYRWVCQGEGSSDLFRCGKCESRCGRPAGPHAPSLDEREITPGPRVHPWLIQVLSDPNPKRIKKMARTKEPTFGACVQLRHAWTFLPFRQFRPVVTHIEKSWPKFGRLRRLVEIWFGTVLVLPWNLSALGPQDSQKGLDQHRNGLFETKRIDYFFQAEIVAHNHVHKCSLP